MLYAGPDGALTGFEYEVTQAVARELGLTASFVLGTWSDLPAALGQGVMDAVVAGWIPRAELPVSWSETYLESGLCLVVVKGSPIRTVADLRGRKVAVYPDPGVTEWTQTHLAESQLTVTTKGLYELVAQGEVDALVYDFPYVCSEILPYRDRLRIVGINLSRFGYAVMLPRGELALVDAVNQAIRTVKMSEPYGRWLRSWFQLDDLGRDVLDLGPSPQRGGRTYTTKGWESLREVARQLWKDPARWVDLWHANGSHVPFPELVPPGTLLTVP
jgi:cystine transport system substrate-binding protein